MRDRGSIVRRRRGALLALLASACSPIVRPRLAPGPADAATRRYSRAEIATDVGTLFTTYEHVHPDLYAVTPRDSMARARSAFLASLPDSVSRLDVAPGLSRLVALVGDGHTTIGGWGEEQARFMDAGGTTLPLGVDRDDRGRLVVSAVYVDPADVRRGDRLVAVNGLDADSLVGVLATERSGESTWWRERQAVAQFAGELWTHGVRAPFTLGVQGADGAVRTVATPGATRADMTAWAERRRAASGAAAGAVSAHGLAYRRLEDGVAYLDFSGMGAPAGPFRARLDSIFGRIAADSARALVIDLRRNGGGNSERGADVIAHFATRPYRLSASKDWRMSAEYRSYLRSMLHPAIRWLPVQYVHPMGRKLFLGPEGGIVRLPQDVVAPEPAEPRFAGPVCVLIGAGTFSSAMETADGIATYRLATVLGEETGGLPTAFGEVYSFRLPITGLVAGVSSARFVRASGDTTDRGPVRPDIVVRRTADDVAAGRDPVLDRARRCAELARP